MKSAALTLNVSGLPSRSVNYQLVHCHCLTFTVAKLDLIVPVFGSSSVEGSWSLCFQSLLNLLTLASIKVLPHLDGPYDCTGVAHVYQTLNMFFVSTISFHQASLNEKSWIHQSATCLLQTTVIIVINIHGSTCYSKILNHICRKI